MTAKSVGGDIGVPSSETASSLPLLRQQVKIDIFASKGEDACNSEIQKKTENEEVSV